MLFAKSRREKNFSLYIQCLEKLLPYFFALDHTNYSRWIPVHAQDMKSLPEIFSKKSMQHWTITKSNSIFSNTPISQAHKQNNAGGAIVLTENKKALQKWLVIGPDLARMVNYGVPGCKQHWYQAKWSKHCLNNNGFISLLINQLIETMKESNPFDNSANQEVVEAMLTLKENGVKQLKKYW